MSSRDLFVSGRWRRFFEPYAKAPFVTFGIPALTVAAAIVLDRSLYSVFHRNPLLFFYGAVMVSAWWGGLPAGLLSTALSALAVDHLFSPISVFNVHPDDLAEIILFISVGIVTSTLSQTLHTSQQRLRSKLRQQAALATLGQHASGERPLNEILQEACEVVAEVLQVKFSKILELAPGGEDFVLRAGTGWNPGCVGHSRVSAIDNTQGAYTLRAANPVLLHDLGHETRFSAPPLLIEHHIVSGLSVIIWGDGTPYGVLGAHSGGRHAFAEEDVVFLQGVANLLSVVIQRERQTKELAESEARFRVLTESIPQMCWSTTPDGAVDYISQSWCDFTGLTQSQSLGYAAWQIVVHPDDLERVAERWRAAMLRGDIYEVECRLRTASGSFRWILARGVPMRNSQGRIQKWFGTCTDIHSQKIAEESLRKAEKLYAAGRLATTVAHEINNPLASITNLVFLAKTAAGNSDMLQQYLQDADQELRRVAHMMNQTLGFSSYSTVSVITSPAEIVDEMVSLYKQKIDSKRLRIETEYRNLKPVVMARTDLCQVIGNVLLNAIDASPVGGAVHLRIRSKSCWKDQRHHGICISIVDRGGGIPIASRKQVFQPFFTTKKHVGIGLGLWRVKAILDHHNGAIRFKTSTRPGRSGTIFTIFFPVQKPQPSAINVIRKAAS